MRRKVVHLIAAIAELLRFIAIVFLAYSVGALLDSSVSNLLRYACAPQLLFAAGFFFMWLDPARYSSYRPLLAVGKIAGAVCFLPLSAALIRDPGMAGSTFGIPYLGIFLAFFIAVVDIVSFCVAALVGTSPSMADPLRPSNIGAGPDDIERIEE